MKEKALFNELADVGENASIKAHVVSWTIVVGLSTGMFMLGRRSGIKSAKK